MQPASPGELQQGLPTPHSPAGLLEFGLGWQLQSCWINPRTPKAGAAIPGRKELGETQTIAAFLQAGAALLLPPSQPAASPWNGSRETHRQVGQTGESPSILLLLLPMDPATAKSLSLPLSGAGLGASLWSEARCAWQKLDLWVLHAQQHPLNPVWHPKALTPRKPRRCPDVQAQTGSPGGIQCR